MLCLRDMAMAQNYKQSSVNNTGIQGVGYKESENSSKVNHGC